VFQPKGVEPINVCAGFAATFHVWGSGLKPGLQMQIMGLVSNLFPCSVANGESATCSLSANDLGPGNLMGAPPIVATIFLIQEGNVEPFNGFFVWISACM
jgi:hypothetical protein